MKQKNRAKVRKAQAPLPHPNLGFPGSSVDKESGCDVGQRGVMGGGNQEPPLACRGYHPPRVASHSHTCFPFPLISPRPSSATKRSDERGNAFPRLGQGNYPLS